MKILDCTPRDGGYYNSWVFPLDLMNSYLHAMNAAGANIVELGLRSLTNNEFKGASAYTTEAYLHTLSIPDSLQVSVMVNAVELLAAPDLYTALEKLFPVNTNYSLVSVVRIACHVHEFIDVLPATNWLKDRGYIVGFNLMQVTDRTKEDIEQLALNASKYPLDVLYFADSMGSMNPAKTKEIISWFRKYWSGDMGIHTHDNMGLALANTLQALDEGVTWLDSTVTGMGRGPGNARTEELLIEVSRIRKQTINIVPLMKIIHDYFQPLKNKCGWGSNPYYYLAGMYGIHPTYIQEMMGDARYSEEDILAVIEHLNIEGGKRFSFNALDSARHFYQNKVKGGWAPKSLVAGREVIILGAGPGVADHKTALESYIKDKKPIVIALNTQSSISQDLIKLRVACHPVRLLADCQTHTKLPQPLVTPASVLPKDLIESFREKDLLDFGLSITPNTFSFFETSAVLPNPLVISYALALASSGQASRVLLAGFDGYGADDPRTKEMQAVLDLYRLSASKDVLSVTPTSYNIPTLSIYGLQGNL